MNRTINRMKIFFLGVFFVGAVLAWAYQVFYVGPMKRCEAEGRWWDAQGVTCATPIAIWDLTGRPPEPGETPSEAAARFKAEADARKAAEAAAKSKSPAAPTPAS